MPRLATATGYHVELRRGTEPAQAGSQDAADELRAGLDHYALHVPELADLDEWAAHLDALEVPHSGIKRTDYAARITLRDPDNIQLELDWPKLNFWVGRFAAPVSPG